VRGPVLHRSDIGKEDLIQKRVDHMKKLRPCAHTEDQTRYAVQ
jgi:hypothetical protein